MNSRRKVMRRGAGGAPAATRWWLAVAFVAALVAVTPAALAQSGLDLFRGTLPVEKVTLSASANFETVQPGQQVVVAVVVDVADGYHAQSADPLTPELIPFRIRTDEAATHTAYAAVYADGTLKNYPVLSPQTGGDISLYVGRTVHFIPVEVAADVEAGGEVVVSGVARYQACDDTTCDPPADASWSVTLPVVASEPSPGDTDVFATFDPATWGRLQRAGGDGQTAFNLFGWRLDLLDVGVLGTFGLAFVAGVVFNVVPCVLPVLPLKALSFYEVSQHNRGRTLLLGIAFGSGVVLVFLALGVMLFALQLFSWGEPFSNPWFSGTVAVVLGVMAFYQFGFLTLNLPAGVYAVTPRHDTLSGNVAFGGLTAVLSTPCTFGLFAALLSWALTQPAWLAVSAITVVGVGMASPYVLLSAFPEVARGFPRTGAVSDVVKKATGFLVLAIALFFAKVALRPILPTPVAGNAYWWVVFAPVAVGCLYVMVQGSRVTRRVGTAVCLAVGGTVLAAATAATLRLTNDPFETFVPDQLSRLPRPVLVKFTADWCLNCKSIEATVFGDSDFVAGLRRDGVTLLKADLTSADADGWPLLAELNPTRAIPFTAVYLPGRDAPVPLTGMYGRIELRDTLVGVRP